MNVADLQQHLADLGRLLEASGAKNVAADLAAIRDGLDPFRGLPLKGFADFLVRAEAYSRGEVSIIRPKGGKKRATSTKGASPNVADLAREVRQLYDQAANPAVTEEKIDAMLGRLGALRKDGLGVVLDAIELKGMKSKSKVEILKAIRLRIVSRKGATQRAGLLDRPAHSMPNQVNSSVHEPAVN